MSVLRSGSICSIVTVCLLSCRRMLATARGRASSTAITARRWWTRTRTTAVASRWLQTDEQLDSSSQKWVWPMRRSFSARSTGWLLGAWRARRTSACSVSEPPLAVKDASVSYGRSRWILLGRSSSAGSSDRGGPDWNICDQGRAVQGGSASDRDLMWNLHFHELGLIGGTSTLTMAAQVASCEALNGFPKANITWYRNNARLVSTPGRESLWAGFVTSVTGAKLTLTQP